jgi:hypothetical protein
MTPAQERNISIAAALLKVTHSRRNTSVSVGDLTMLCSEIPTEPCLWLDAWLKGFGKVASFRIYERDEAVEVVSLKVKLLPQWIPMLRAGVQHCASSTTKSATVH